MADLSEQDGLGTARAQMGHGDSVLLAEHAASLAWTWLRCLQKPSSLLMNTDNVSFQNCEKDPSLCKRQG